MGPPNNLASYHLSIQSVIHKKFMKVSAYTVTPQQHFRSTIVTTPLKLIFVWAMLFVTDIEVNYTSKIMHDSSMFLLLHKNTLKFNLRALIFNNFPWGAPP